MTFVIALIVIALLPVCVQTFKSPMRRPIGFTLLSLLPFLTNLPISGFIIGWAGWFGTVRGISVSLVDTVALSLILTRSHTRNSLSFWGIIALYGIAIVFPVFFSAVWMATVFYWWQLIRVSVMFAAIGGEGHRPDVRVAVWRGLALGLMYEAAFVVFQKLHGVVQAPGTLVHQNILGLMIELSLLPLAGALLTGARGRLLAGGVLAALICTAGTGSRGTLGIVLGALVILALISTIRRATPRKLSVVAGGAVLVALATPFALSTLNNRFHGASYVTEEDERKSFEAAAESMAHNHPFGVGANQFVLVSNRDGYAEQAGVPWQSADRSMPVHNAYLLARAESGWFGEVAFMLLLFYPIFIGLRFAFARKKDLVGDLALGSVVALGANALHNRYEFASHTFPVQCLIFLNIGILAALIRGRSLENIRHVTLKVRTARMPLVGPRSAEFIAQTTPSAPVVE